MWAVDQDGVLTLEMGEDDALLAQVVLDDGKLNFYLIGDTQGAEPRGFSRGDGAADNRSGDSDQPQRSVPRRI